MTRGSLRQAAVLERIGELLIKNVEIPRCPTGGILIKIEACAICATDVKV